MLRSDAEPSIWWGSPVAIARGASIDKATDVRTEEELRRAYDRILGEDGPLAAR